MQVNFLSYALAIFQVAENKQKQNLYYKQIRLLDKLNDANPDFVKLLSIQKLTKAERKDIAKQILKKLNFDDTLIHWVWTIIDANQYQNFPIIKRYCMEVHHAIFKIIRVEVTSADPLEKKQLSKINDFFKKRLKAEIDLKVIIKPDVIGGLKIQLNNKTYNNTFKYKLEELKKALLSKKG